MNTSDRRVRKTRKALQVALAELMSEKELRQITVQELADQADVHRATFYLHYQDVHDLYAQLEDQILQEAVSLLSNEVNDYSGIYRSVVNYLLENRAFGSMIFGKFGNGSFQRRVTDAMEQRYLELWLLEESSKEITTEMRYLTTYHMRGCISILERWVQSGYSESPEEIFRLLRFVNEGFEAITE